MRQKMFIVLLLSPLVLWAQEDDDYRREYSKLRLGFEAGVGLLEGQTLTPGNVRESQSYYFDSYYDHDYYCGFVNNSNSIPYYYLGVKPEISLNTSISVAAGLRFTGSHSVLDSDRNYFLWKISENNLTTEYVRIKSVKQNNLYVSVPLEMTVFTYKRDIMVRHFFKAGVNFNFLLASKATPYFENEEMNKYADKIKNEMKKNANFMPTAFVGMGLKFGRMSRLFGTVEIKVPVVLRENTSFSSFVKSSAGFEFQTTIYFPLGKEKVYTKKMTNNLKIK